MCEQIKNCSETERERERRTRFMPGFGGVFVRKCTGFSCLLGVCMFSSSSSRSSSGCSSSETLSASGLLE